MHLGETMTPVKRVVRTRLARMGLIHLLLISHSHWAGCKCTITMAILVQEDHSRSRQLLIKQQLNLGLQSQPAWTTISTYRATTSKILCTIWLRTSCCWSVVVEILHWIVRVKATKDTWQLNLQFPRTRPPASSTTSNQQPLPQKRNQNHRHYYKAVMAATWSQIICLIDVYI